MALLAEVVFAAGAGFATFLAPCAFPLIPGYVGYYLSRADAPKVGRAAAGAAIGATAALAVIVTIGVRVGSGLLQYIPQLEPLIGIVLVIAGVALLRGDSGWHMGLGGRPEEVHGFVIFGGLYAVAAAGCVAPILMGIIAGSLRLSAAQQLIVICTYTISMAVPLGVVTVVAAVTDARMRSLGALSGHVQRLGGVILILAGGVQTYLSLFVWGVL